MGKPSRRNDSIPTPIVEGVEWDGKATLELGYVKTYFEEFAGFVLISIVKGEILCLCLKEDIEKVRDTKSSILWRGKGQGS